MKRTTIIDFVEQYTRKYSSLTFLREKVDGVWTETSFEETREEAYRIGAGLVQLGLHKGDKVSLLSQGRNLWITSELGILYAGGVNVPLSIKLTESTDLLFRIQHSDSRFVVVSEQQLPKIRSIIGECPKVEKVIVLDPIADYRENEMPISEVIAMGEAYLKEHSEEFKALYESVQPDDYANISYTSGTTADPKGILLTHRNYTANVEQGASVISCNKGDVMLIILPLDHCFAHVAGFYTMMYYGGSIATVPVGKTAIATLKNIPIAIKEVRPMLMLSVPALARNFRKNIETSIKAKGKIVERLYEFALNNAIQYNKEYWNRGGWQAWRWPLVKLFDKIIFKAVREGFGGRMRFFVGGGALLDIELQRYFCAVGMPMFQGYGLSEATPIICANSMGHAVFGSSGRIVSPLDLKICDDEGNEVPHGQKGEIVKSIDLSNDNERIGVCIADLRIISILYAIEYLQNQHNACLSDIPIFSTFPYASVKPYHYRNIYAEYANTPSLSSIDEWKFEIMKRIGTDHHCRIFQWKKKLWGDGPIYNE